MNRLRWDVNKAFEKYKQGCSLKVLARKNNVHYSTIRIAFKKIFGEAYLNIAKERRPKNKLTARKIRNLFQKYKSGESVYKLAKRYGINDNILYSHFSKIPEYNKISMIRKIQRRISLETIYGVWDEYKSGVPLDKISKKYKMSRNTLIKYLKKIYENKYNSLSKEHRLNASLSNVKSAINKNQKIKKKEIKAIISMRIVGKSVYEIAEYLNVTPPTITLYLKKYDKFIPFDRAEYILSKGMKGEKNAEEFLKILRIPYESQKVLSNDNKPDFLLAKAYFVEVKSKFLTDNEFYKIMEKYLTAEELKGGIIIAFYGYSKRVIKIAQENNIIILDGNDIKNYFRRTNQIILMRCIEEFMNLNYNKWKLQKELINNQTLYEFEEKT